GNAVVVGQRVVHRVDAGMVGIEVDHAVRLADLRLALLSQLALHRLDERRKRVQHQRAAFADQPGQLRIDAGTHHHRANTDLLAFRPDPRSGLARALRAVDEGNAVGTEAGVGKLGQQAVADRLGSDAGAVGNIEDRARVSHV